MKKALFAALLVVILTACAPAPPTTDVQNTAIAIVQTGVALTQTALPTATPTFTPTATPTALPTFSPVPTLVRPIFTPDAIQLERWQEYQTKLAEALNTPIGSLCEWDILGRSGQEVYVWAYCINENYAYDHRPAEIHLNTDGSIQEIKAARYWMGYGDIESNEKELFPKDIIEKLYFYKGFFELTGRPEELKKYLHYRLANPGTLPWVVLLGTPTGTPTP